MTEEVTAQTQDASIVSYASKDEFKALQEMVANLSKLLVTKEQVVKEQAPANPSKSIFTDKEHQDKEKELQLQEQARIGCSISNIAKIRQCMVEHDSEYEATFKSLELDKNGRARDVTAFEPEIIFNYCKVFYDSESEFLKYQPKDIVALCEKIKDIQDYDSVKISTSELKEAQKIVDSLRRYNNDKHIEVEKKNLFNNAIVTGKPTKREPQDIFASFVSGEITAEEANRLNGDFFTKRRSFYNL